MIRFSPLVPLMLAASLPVLAGCGEDSPTGPGEAVGKVEIRPFAGTLQVTHDCDPNKDNPGDFAVHFEVQVDDRPEDNRLDWVTVGQSSELTASVHSDGSKAFNQALAPHVVDLVPGMRVRLTAVAEERDGGSVDSRITARRTLVYDGASNCWFESGVSGCEILEDAPAFTWTSDVEFRDDEFKLFNSDDEGCHFSIGFGVIVSPPAP